jgi:hypothetical protein
LDVRFSFFFCSQPDSVFGREAKACAGLLLPGERKSVEPMAARAARFDAAPMDDTGY